MRHLASPAKPTYPNYEDWLQALSSGPLLIGGVPPRRQRRYSTTVRGAIRLRRSFISVSRADYYKTDGINYRKECLRLHPGYIEFLDNNDGDYRILRDILAYYDLDVRYPTFGKNKYKWCVVWPSNLTDAAFNRSVRMERGLQIGYEGKCYTHTVPTAAQAQKDFDKSYRRHKSASERQDNINRLGFISPFDLDGYTMPADLTFDKINAMNAVASKLGYRDVADAWQHDVPIYGEITDDFLIEHKEGLTSLLVQAEKERRKRD